MVLETRAAARPRRMAAMNGAKEAAGRMNGSTSDQPKSGSLAKRPVRAKARPSVAVAEDTESDLTESSDEEEEVASSLASASEDEDDEDDGDSFTPVKGKANKARRSAVSAKPVKKAAVRTPSASKPRAKANKAAATPKTTTPKAKRGPATKAATASRPGRRGGSKEELPINSDNVLFNAVKSPDSDLRAVAEEWMGYYQDNYAAALAQFVNFVFRACGSNESIDETQVDDTDKVVEVLEEIQDTFKKVNPPSYPLISRAATYRKFRRSLNGLVELIFTAASEADVLDDDRMVDTMVAWVGAMSSSTFRAFRHTATTITLLMVGQIARLNQDARKQFEQTSKMRDAEKGKKGSADSARVKQLNDQVRQINAKRQMLDRFHKDLDETVFIHRYRDSDPTIRADCMEELGRWMRICPAQFLNNNYLRYFAWELSDESALVRLVVVQALKMLFARQEADTLPQALETFTQRSLDRMVEIATGDVDTPVRIAMVNTLVQIDRLGAIDEDEDGGEEVTGEVHAVLTRHIFDSDAKVRLAVAQYVVNLVERKVPDVEEFADEDEHKKAQLKALAALLARVDAELNDERTQTQVEVPLSGTLTQSRVSLAVRALLETTELLQDWAPLLDLLVADHSGDRDVASRSKGARKPTSSALRLDSAEEAVLIECLVVLMQKASETLPREEDDGEDVASVMTKDLISALPKLLNKYKTEASRISDVLLLIKHMKLAKYLEFQQMTAYEALWDQVIDQFQRHTESDVIGHAVEAMKAMAATSALSTVNEVKLHELRELTVTALKEAGPSFAQLTSMRSLAADDAHSLTACTSRLKHLIRLFDLSENFDEADEDHNGGGAWDVLLACAQRAPMELAAEASMVEDAIVSLALYIIWKTSALVGLENDDAKATQAELLLGKRQAFLSLCERIFEVSSDEGSTSGAKRQAFGYLLDIHIMYANLAALDEERAASLGNDSGRKVPEVLHLTLSANTQEILATFAVAELKCFNADSQKEGNASQASAEDDADDDAGDKRVTLSFLRKQHAFVSMISHYIGAIRLGLLDIQRSAPLLAYYGRMGALYDACLRVLVEGVREVGIHQRRASVACTVLLNALVQAFELVRAAPETELTFVNLAKMLSSCIVVRGAHLTVLQSVDAAALTRLHERLVEWSLSEMREIDGPGTLSLSMFKAMAQLLIGVQPREALTIKAAMDRSIAAHQVEVSATAKAWEPLRSYEKRLVTIASKSDAIKRKVAGRAQQPAPTSSPAGGQQTDQASHEGDEDDVAAPSSPTSARQAPRARPRAKARAPRSTQDSAGAGFSLTQQDEDDVDSILGRRASQKQRRANDSDEEMYDGDEDDGFGNVSAALSLPAFDLSQTTSAAEASQLFRGSFEDATQSQRPARRARPSRSLLEEQDSDDDEATQRSRSKRSRQK